MKKLFLAVCLFSLIGIQVQARELCGEGTECVEVNGYVTDHLETMKKNGNYFIKIVQKDGTIKEIPFNKSVDYMYKEFNLRSGMIITDRELRGIPTFNMKDVWEKYDPVKEN